MLGQLLVVLLCGLQNLIGDIERGQDLQGPRKNGGHRRVLLGIARHCEQGTNSHLRNDTHEDHWGGAQQHLRNVQLQNAAEDAGGEIRACHEDADLAQGESSLVQNHLHGPCRDLVHSHEALHMDRLASQVADEILPGASHVLQHGGENRTQDDALNQLFICGSCIESQNHAREEVYCSSGNNGQHEHEEANHEDQATHG
mmetsp:Transcript_31819/g.68531  ORF Transcript_31819/g.68531 Transcript_31819/m.68531 type:complete len:200 (-) Transcript_31819:1453-2052(-)